jgi:uncharacterized protein YecT (DUF1311 family)
MKRLKALMIAVALVIMATAPGTLAQTQRQITDSACSDYRQADAELNRVYRRIVAEYQDDKLFLEKLKKAQQAWIAYRDADVESLYPAPDKKSEYGSIYETCYCTALQQVTLQRTEMLQQWLRGVAEGDVCAGSRKTR